jgi:hypothetical protein
MLPDVAAGELFAGLVSHHACGFHSGRWAASFVASCEAVLGTGTAPATFVAPAAADADDIRAVAASPEGGAALTELEERVGERRLIVRVDRIELSKNLLRGFHAFDDLLRTHPQWRERVVFGAFVYPSREGLPEYLAYRQEVEGLVARINATWASPTWTPILYDPQDDFPRSVAALRRYDVLLVNPVRDGLNLVAKEGALVNERDGVLALSRESGAWDELGGVALEVHPFDVAATSDVLHRGLTMAVDERRGARLGAGSGVRVEAPADWLADQLAAPPCTVTRTGTAHQRAERLLDAGDVGSPALAPPLPAWGPSAPSTWTGCRRARRQPAARRSRTASAPRGPSTTRSARASTESGDSSVRTAMRTASPPSAANRSRASKAGRSPTSSPRKQAASRPATSASTTVPLVGRDGRVELDRRLGRPHVEAAPGGLRDRPVVHLAGALGRRAEVQGEGGALGLDDRAQLVARPSDGIADHLDPRAGLRCHRHLPVPVRLLEPVQPEMAPRRPAARRGRRPGDPR